MRAVILNDEKQFSLPESWNELTGEQLIAISPLLLKSEVNLLERTFIAQRLCGFDFELYIRHNEFLAKELLEKIIPELQFLFTSNTLTKQLLPVIEVGSKYKFFGTRKLHGPSNNFDNLTIAEFSDTETCLLQWEETKEDIWLNRFIAILYRPRKRIYHPHASDFDGDIRQAYNFHLNDFIAAMVSKLPEAVKLSLLLWYMGCRAELVANHSFLFSEPNKEAASGQGGSWTDVIHGLAGAKFGTIEETCKANLKVVIKELYLLYQQAEALKQ